MNIERRIREVPKHSPDGTAPPEAGRKPHRDTPQAAQRLSSYVLVVDDESVVRQFLTRCLESWRYTVQQAASAVEALDMMEGNPASVVLCDIRMPGHDGLWLAERLRAQWPTTPVIMVTAIDDVETVKQSRDFGVAYYVTKPITPAHLLQVLRQVTAAPNPETPMADDFESPLPEVPALDDVKIEAEYTLESPVRCPACGERITTIKAVRLIRAQVNFTSTLPRRGRVLACPNCLAVIPAELSNF